MKKIDALKKKLIEGIDVLIPLSEKVSIKIHIYSEDKLLEDMDYFFGFDVAGYVFNGKVFDKNIAFNVFAETMRDMEDFQLIRDSVSGEDEKKLNDLENDLEDYHQIIEAETSTNKFNGDYSGK
jgi:hypothetical protein